jgi:hypothetical protein
LLEVQEEGGLVGVDEVRVVHESVGEEEEEEEEGKEEEGNEMIVSA